MSEQDFSKGAIAAGRALFSRPPRFVMSVFHLKDLPPLSIPEIAFAGRSNVGKSSIINAVVQKKGLAKTSNTPGRTQCLNFFSVDDIFYVVDMPGYGYAEAPKKLVQSWQKLIKEYLLGRTTLKRVYVLIDSRHGVKENDVEVMKLLDECAVSYQVILTKADKISKADQDKCLADVTARLLKHPAAFPTVLLTSSEKGTGIDEFRAAIAETLGK